MNRIAQLLPQSNVAVGVDAANKRDLSLPKSDAVGAEVRYIERSAEEVLADTVTESDLKTVDEKQVEEKSDSIEVSELDHFTVFVVVAPNQNLNTSGNGVENEGNGWASDNNYVLFNEASDFAEYGFPNLGIPAGSSIEGVEVSIEGYRTGGSGNNGRYLTAALWNKSGNSYTATQQASLGATDSVHVLGGATDAWGKTWTAADFADADFKIKVVATGNTNSGNAYLDQVQVKVYYTVPAVPVSNPSLSRACGLDIALVIDNSTSISTTELNQMKSAMTGFTSALSGTPTQFSVTRFATTGSVVQAFTGNIGNVNSAISGIPVDGGFTNWQDGLTKAKSTLPNRSNPDLVIFASDGNPNRTGASGTSVAESVAVNDDGAVENGLLAAPRLGDELPLWRVVALD